ncbi:MAG: cation-translocating P-type ATPase [bacterium]|nr:cation-translocating P-type ATPase [bacterium]
MLSGLTQKEASSRLKANGYNELPSAKPRKLTDFLVEIIKEPMISLLLVACVLYLFLGDKVEAALLLLSIAGVVSISLYQEKKSEKSLQALASLSSPRAIVIRDGEEIRIPGREVVVGDLVILAEGDRVPADVELKEAVNLSVDESLLTGESQSVSKNINQDSKVFSGTMVISGHGFGEVKGIGLDTELGKIGKSLRSIEIEKTLLQKEIKTFVKWIAIIGISLCVILAIISILTGMSFIEGTLAGLTLAIGILPEEFPIVLILFMTMGAWRLAKHNVLTRRAAAIETLGAATVLCVDKTGTITKNQMSIEKIFTNGGIDLNDFATDEGVIKYGILASQRKPFDPMESAFIHEGKKLFDTDVLFDEFSLVKEYPIENSFLCVAHAYQGIDKGFEVALKGAPESVLELCHVTEKEKRMVENEVKKFAKEGLRVIAVASGHHHGKYLPENRHDIQFNFLGLVGLKDPVRKGVKDSVRSAYDAGIRIIMITGDYKETALDIARQIGLVTEGVVIGDEFEAMNGKEREATLKKVNVFSRVRPNQKLLIIKELKSMGEVVAMTGDGVNDAPALKAANIGVAMGRRGTDVAREAAAIVLLDDNFNSIVGGVKMGRRIYDNLQKAINYLISVHIPIVILSILPVIFGVPFILMPVHIVFLEFIIDPTCTIVFEADKEDRDIMNRPPRKLDQRIIAFKNLYASIINGSIIGIILFISYMITFQKFGETIARTFTFIMLVFLILALMIVNLSRKENFISKLKRNDNFALIGVVSFTLVVMYFATHIENIMNVFRFGSLVTFQWVQIIGVAIGFLLLNEITKSLNGSCKN